MAGWRWWLRSRFSVASVCPELCHSHDISRRRFGPSSVVARARRRGRPCRGIPSIFVDSRSTFRCRRRFGDFDSNSASSITHGCLSNLLLGFSVALTPINLFWCLVGVILGTVVGVLPGLGPAATIAMLLPLTLKMDHTTAIIALAGIFYGARYGGSTTSILLNIPGESSSVVTCLDGYQMARKGRAGAALGISAIASFVAGTVGVLGLMLIAPPLARFALRFAPPEYFALDGVGTCDGGFLGRRVDG